MATAPTHAPFFVDNEVIRLSSNGVWIADGVEISHDPSRKLFARSLVRHDDGTYWLHIGRETKRIEIEDTAYFVQRVDVEDSAVWITLNDETCERLNPSSLAYRPGRLTCRITRCEHEEEAKFLHASYFDLLRSLQEDGDSYFLVLEGKRIDLARKS